MRGWQQPVTNPTVEDVGFTGAGTIGSEFTTPGSGTFGTARPQRREVPVLDILDPDSDHGRVYRQLLTEGPSTPARLAGDGLTPADVRGVLSDLADAEAVGPAGEDTWVARSPDRVMAGVLRQEERRRDRLWAAGAELDALYRRAVLDAGGTAGSEVIATPEELLVLTARLQERAVHQVRWLDRPPYWSGPGDFAAQERLQTRRMLSGLRYRTVYHQAVYDDAGLLAAAARMIDRGEQARVLADLPVKLTIGDDRLALLVPEPDRRGVEGALLIHPSGLLNALIGIFESLWTLAVPLSVGAGAEALSAQDRTIITLMATGVTDDVIARRLDLSRRTVVRRIAVLLDRLGATTRFQAGVQAAHRGWL